MSQTQREPWIDADTHITEPADVWTSRVPARWRDRVPQVRWDDKNGEECWFLGDAKMVPVGMTALAGWPEKFPQHPPTFEAAHEASYDASARIRYMDEVGCRAHVLYPNVGGFGNQFFLRIPDPELKLACVRAYNDFLVDWISPDPSRFIPIMATPFWDVPAATAELLRCARLGFKGVLFTAAPQDFGLPLLSDPHWDPLWSVAQEAGLPISFHIGSGDDFGDFSPERIASMGMAPAYALSSCRLFLNNGMQLADLLLSGVLARFPELRFVSVESGIGWVPFVLEAADYSLAQGDVSDGRRFDLKPSEYFHRQVYACYWFEREAKQHFEAVGTGNILFETDFPHPTCLYGNIDETIDAGLGSLSEGVRRSILFDNAAALYGL